MRTYAVVEDTYRSMKTHPKQEEKRKRKKIEKKRHLRLRIAAPCQTAKEARKKDKKKKGT
jgi:hypothetical protein